MKIAVLGAGIAGISAGFHAQEKHPNAEVIIYEKSNDWGGLCSGFYVDSSKGKFWFDNAVHLSFAKDPYVQKVFAESSKPILHTPSITNYFQGSWLKHPAQNNLFHLPVEMKVKAIKDMIDNHNKKENLENFEEWLKAQYGTFFTENFSMKYTRKYWSVEAKELNTNAKWVGSRFYQPSVEEVLQGAMTDDTPVTYYAQEQRYPKEGRYKSFLKNLVRQTTIEYNKEVKCIDTKKKVLSFTDGKQTSYDALISTLPLPEIIKTMPDAHKDVKDAAKNLHHTQVALISLGFNKPDIPKNLWFYVYDEDILFARVYSPSKKSPNNVPKGCSSLQAEVYFSKFKPLEKLAPKGSNLSQYFLAHTKDWLVRMGGGVVLNDVICEDFRILPYGNIMFTHGIERYRKIALDFLQENGVISCGRFGEWDYLWSDESFLSGKKAVDKILIRS